MKKVLVVSMVATVLGTSVVSAVSAAPAVKPAANAAQVQNSTLTINGNSVVVRSIVKNGETLVSLRDVIKAIGAQAEVHSGTTVIKLNDHSVTLQNNSKQIVVDDVKVNLNQPVTIIGGTSYIALRPLVSGVGGTIVKRNGLLEISTVSLIDEVENPRFAGADKLIVSKNDNNGRNDYLVNTTSGKYELLLTTDGGSDLVISPSGDQAAYTNAEGAVYVIDLKTKASKLITSDNSIKPELVWSADGNAIYFLQGDKGSVIAKLNLADGAITKVVEDKVDYKENLNVSADGKKFIYTVTTLGTVTSDTTNVDEDNVSIDFSSNQQQIFSYNTGDSKPEAVKLTTSTDDKVFVWSADGQKAYYVSVPSEDGKASLLSVDSSQKSTPVYAEYDVEQAILSGGTLYVLAAQDDSNSVILSIDPVTGKQTKLYTVSSDVSSIAVAGTQISVVENGRVLVQADGSWRAVTK
ncbi:stalk domain-containing protein [Paenibacillus taichungensis]|uniref:stalk domain-containing protein n=1 Tax=Paenibacillus taichungensis TaxID=484184 RepID=UPI002DBB1FED|nr:stalk domain-containing protein [Paenibacillus taichungensis]MEC0108694.1 stalk domain-containing protein [Paenibacillus taichungensis]MEC0196194.1 stalk domain-containing protein [Paenibacillus taichungensis]